MLYTTFDNNSFLGHIKQVPSMFSALKHQGKPLYKYARAGIDIERPARDVSIHQLLLSHFDGQQMDLTVTCSKGTYIRNLVEDIGEQLEVYAHVTRLHRRYTAGLADEPMYTIEELQAKSPEQLMASLLPMERAVSYLPRVTLTPESVFALRQGKIINYPLLIGTSSCVRLYENDTQFIGLGELGATGLLKVKRLLTESGSTLSFSTSPTSATPAGGHFKISLV